MEETERRPEPADASGLTEAGDRMSFASNAKKELCRTRPHAVCCEKAEAYGLSLFARSFSPKSISFMTENRAVADRYADLMTAATGCIIERTAPLTHREGFLTLSAPDTRDRERIFAFFGHRAGELNLRINRSNLENECCISAFLRGAFLACGTVTDPSRDYHLEWAVPFRKLAGDLMALVAEAPELDLRPKLATRKGGFVVYLKGSEAITDLLAYIGAQNAAMELMQVKMVKEVRNYVNRTTNFETANLGKTAAAAAEQLEAIAFLEERQGLASLPEDLRELAKLRLQYPEYSLRELGEALSEPISRSGVNHRLKRLMELSRELGKPEGKGEKK